MGSFLRRRHDSPEEEKFDPMTLLENPVDDKNCIDNNQIVLEEIKEQPKPKEEDFDNLSAEEHDSPCKKDMKNF